MVNASKAKGTRWEVAVVRCLRSHGIPARRHVQEAVQDAGDLHGLSPFVGQAKDYADTVTALRLGVNGAERQAVVAGEPYGVAFIKRARASAGSAYAVMTLDTFARVWRRLESAESLLAAADPDAYAAHAWTYGGGHV